MKKKLIELSLSGEYQKPMINVIDVLLSDSVVMASPPHTVDYNGTGTPYTPGGGWNGELQ